MSVATDRMDTIIARTVPVPFDPSLLPHLPYWPELFAVVVALGQAWPVVRDEVQHLTERCARLAATCDQLTAERDRIAANATAEATRRADEADRDKAIMVELFARLDAATTALAKATTTTTSERAGLADAVCASIDAHHQQRGRVNVWIDGAAWDAWKKAAR